MSVTNRIAHLFKDPIQPRLPRRALVVADRVRPSEGVVAMLRGLGLRVILLKLQEGTSNAAERILDAATTRAVDCIALFAKAPRWFTRFGFAPTIAETVSRMSSIPVLVLPQTEKGHAGGHLLSNVLVPHDGSPSAWAPSAIDQLVELIDPASVAMTILGASPKNDAAGEVRDALEVVAARAWRQGFSARTTFDRSYAAEAIIRRARSGNATLVAMGQRDPTVLSRLVLGSTTREVLDGASVPVLVCPRPRAVQGRHP